MNFDLVAFDWDGTLFDSTALIVRSIQAASADLGLAVPTDAQAAWVIGMGLHDALAHATPGLPPERYKEMALRYRHHYMAKQHEVVLFEGTVHMLRGLKERGQRIAVATGKGRQGLNHALSVVQLGDFFDATRTADETAPKPDPRMLHELMDELGVPAARTLMVGDTTHDLQLAANAGVASVAVSYGAHEPGAFEAFNPLAVVHSTHELTQWLQAHG